MNTETTTPTTPEAETVETPPTMSAPEVMMLPIGDLMPDPDQPRKFFDEEELRLLAESIKAHGIINPLTVRRVDDGTIFVIAGEQRLRAAKIAGLQEVPCILNETPKYAEIALIENFNRSDLTAIEKAEALQRIVDSGVSQKDLATRLGKVPSTISDTLSLLRLPKEIKEQCRTSRDFAIRELKRIAVAKPEEQAELFEQYQRKMKINFRLSVNRVPAQGLIIMKAVKMAKKQLQSAEAITDPKIQGDVMKELEELRVAVEAAIVAISVTVQDQAPKE